MARRHGGDDLPAHFLYEVNKGIEQVGIAGDGDAQESQHEVRVDHGILQLGALAFDAVRHLAATDGGQGADQAVGSGKPQ